MPPTTVVVDRRARRQRHKPTIFITMRRTTSLVVVAIGASCFLSFFICCCLGAAEQSITVASTASRIARRRHFDNDGHGAAPPCWTTSDDGGYGLSYSSTPRRPLLLITRTTGGGDVLVAAAASASSPLECHRLIRFLLSNDAEDAPRRRRGARTSTSTTICGDSEKTKSGVALAEAVTALRGGGGGGPEDTTGDAVASIMVDDEEEVDGGSSFSLIEGDRSRSRQRNPRRLFGNLVVGWKQRSAPSNPLLAVMGGRKRRRPSEREEAATHPQKHHQQHHHVSKTSCGRMADDFRRALVITDGDDDDSSTTSSSRIDVTQLLKAAEHYTVEMRRIGQRQSASDMEKNVHKARQLLKVSPHSVHHDLHALLEYEKSTGIHEADGHIKDPSGAVGLLWIRRSLSYQHRMFDLVLNHHVRPPDAALQAYRHELQPFHGWALQKLYSIAMSSMTPGSTQELLAKVGGYTIADEQRETAASSKERATAMIKVGAGGGGGGGSVTTSHHPHTHHTPLSSPHDLTTTTDLEMATRHDLQSLLDAWDPLLKKWKQVYHDLDLEDPRRY